MTFPYQTEMEQIMASIDGAVTFLLRLSAAIRNPATHDRWLNSSRTDVSIWEPIGTRHVEEKFPGINPRLAQRLGAAISMRRGLLKYREEHYLKLASGLNDGSDDSKTVIDSTVASSLPEKLKHTEDIDLDALLENDNESDTGLTATSFATLVGGERALRVPPPPRGAVYGKPFMCPFCFGIFDGNRSKWKSVHHCDMCFLATNMTEESTSTPILNRMSASTNTAYLKRNCSRDDTSGYST
jgi:hypothetical protein